MPGMPKRRAKKLAAMMQYADAGATLPSNEELAAMLGREQMARREQHDSVEHSAEHSTRAPLCSTESRTSARSVRDLYEQMLGGAERALAQLHAGMAAGLDARELKELSVTANVLMRAAKLIEDNKPTDEPPSLAELEAAEAEAARIYAARQGR